jgi:outer membrane protein assembly factor BamB
MKTCYFSLVVFLLFAPFEVAADWPQFRGPNADGSSNAKDVPVEWTESEGVAWKAPIPGRGWSSPVVVDGRLYLTTAIGETNAGSVSLRSLCVDSEDGRIVWNVEVFRPEGGEAKAVHTKNSLASSTPIVHDGRLYVHFGHMGTAALDLKGNVLWEQKVEYPPVHGNGGSPVVVDDALVFHCDGGAEPFIVALELESGDVRWRTPRNSSARKKFSFSTPLAIEVDGETQVISCGSGFVGGYDPADGREIWRVRYDEGYSVVPRPVFAHGLLFVSSGYDRPRAMAIKPNGARGDATDSHIVWTHERGAPLTPSMLVAGDELYFVSDNGVAACLDARTKKAHWTERLGGDFSASPVFADGRIYFLNEDGVVYVIRAGREFELVATNDLKEGALASPAVSDGALYVRTQSHLWRIGS